MQKDLKLPKVFKRKWIALLRSGKYKQATGTLYSTEKDGYCCLGIACIAAGVSLDKIHGGYILKRIARGAKTKIPQMLIYETDSENRIDSGFSELNDSHHWNFDEIAEFIEHAL